MFLSGVLLSCSFHFSHIIMLKYTGISSLTAVTKRLPENMSFLISQVKKKNHSTKHEKPPSVWSGSPPGISIKQAMSTALGILKTTHTLAAIHRDSSLKHSGKLLPRWLVSIVSKVKFWWLCRRMGVGVETMVLHSSVPCMQQYLYARQQNPLAHHWHALVWGPLYRRVLHAWKWNLGPG